MERGTMLLPELDQVKQIYVINDDSLGPPNGIVYELKDSSTQIYMSKSEKKAVIDWFNKNLPMLTSQLQTYLKSKPFEDFLIAVIYSVEPHKL